ncbi:MAG: class B sortase [Lachnospiraceae bacterium]|nr:class B sortase [Lachnospiraceae bacterium]
MSYGYRRERNNMPMWALIVLVSVATIVCIIMVAVMYMDNKGMLGNSNPAKTEDNSIQEVKGEANVVQVDDEALDNMIPKHDIVDIKALQGELNGDVYSWLYIPETGIDAPVLQKEDDVMYYGSHNEKGEEDGKGTLFTQYINSKDYSDNVTVIYGYNDGSDKGFSKLNLFEDPAFLGSHPYVYIYNEESLLIYKIFAAYESDDTHILMYYEPNDDSNYEKYLSVIKDNMGLNANVIEEVWPSVDDKILTLSTRIQGKEENRYLVQAKLHETVKLSELTE